MVKSAAAPEFLHLWPVTGQWVTESRNKHLPSMSWKVADNQLPDSLTVLPSNDPRGLIRSINATNA